MSKLGWTTDLYNSINYERRYNGLSELEWNQNLWGGCKHQSDTMLRMRSLVHARNVPSGGECIFHGKGIKSARAIAKSWMHSPGHRRLMMSPKVASCAVAISESYGHIYATWRGERTGKIYDSGVKFDWSWWYPYLIFLIFSAILLAWCGIGNVWSWIASLHW